MNGLTVVFEVEERNKDEEGAEQSSQGFQAEKLVQSHGWRRIRAQTRARATVSSLSASPPATLPHQSYLRFSSPNNPKTFGVLYLDSVELCTLADKNI